MFIAIYAANVAAVAVLSVVIARMLRQPTAATSTNSLAQVAR